MVLGELLGLDLPIVILIVVVLLFGGAAIPKLARNLGSAKTEFEKGLKAGKNGDAKASDAKASDADETKTPDAES